MKTIITFYCVSLLIQELEAAIELCDTKKACEKAFMEIHSSTTMAWSEDYGSQWDKEDYPIPCFMNYNELYPFDKTTEEDSDKKAFCTTATYPQSEPHETKSNNPIRFLLDEFENWHNLDRNMVKCHCITKRISNNEIIDDREFYLIKKEKEHNYFQLETVTYDTTSIVFYQIVKYYAFTSEEINYFFSKNKQYVMATMEQVGIHPYVP